MIMRMAKVRILGPRESLADVLRVLQDFGLMQVAEAPVRMGLERAPFSARDLRRRRQLRRLVDDAQGAISVLAIRQAAEPVASAAGVTELSRLARRCRRARCLADGIDSAETRLTEERDLIQRYRELLDALAPELRQVSQSPHVTTHAVIVPAAERHAAEQIVAAMGAPSERAVAVRTHVLRTGELVLLIVTPVRSSPQVERLLSDRHLPEVTLPAQFKAASLVDAVPLMLSRLDEIPREQRALADARRALARDYGADMQKGRAAALDALARLDALERCTLTPRAFALDGWTPAIHAHRLVQTLEREVGPSIAAEELATEEWTGEDAPVALSNPRIFRPFEALVSMMPLPRYGSIDPTPFVAVFFPLLFGLMLADVGYGLVLAVIGLVLHRRSRPGSPGRTAAGIIGPCAAFAAAAGLMFGEFFGDFGRRVFGLHALLFDREEAVVAFLLVSVGLGVVHVGLGLVLGAISRWRRAPRHAIGSGVEALMVVVVIVAILAAVKVLPGSLLTPSVIVLLLAFPVLVVVEGIIAPVEFLATLGNILSYARVMALGMASLMLAVVANRMAGAIGSAVVGFLFALLFHLVNFAIGVFGPAVHSLRLHYVEFFGKFYSPGGVPYQPFAHWRAPRALPSR